MHSSHIRDMTLTLLAIPTTIWLRLENVGLGHPIEILGQGALKGLFD